MPANPQPCNRVKPALDTLVQNNALLWRGNSHRTDSNAAVDTGIEPLNDFLPTGGWPANSMVELVVEQWGIGELQVLLPLMSHLSQQHQRLVLIAPPYLPYAPALLSAGIQLDHLVIIDNRIAPEDIWWASEKILRNEGCALVLIWPKKPDYHHIRRLQLAADAGNSLGILMHRGLPTDTPVALRLKLSPCDRGISMRILKSRFSWKRDAQIILPIP